MARLKRPLGGGPLYVRGAGPGRRGTWHINPEGEAWLAEHDYSLPAPGYETFLSQADMLRLEAHLFTFGIPYEHVRPARIEPPAEPERKGLPLLLRLGGKHEAVAPWVLNIELARLEEVARKGQGRDYPKVAEVHLFGTLAAGPVTFDARQLQDSLCWPQVLPQTEPYRVRWQDRRGQTHELPPTPGLQTSFAGNIFVKRRDGPRAETWWQRRLPGESLSDADCAEFYWLAQPHYDPEWPARAEVVRGVFRGWQLWKLSLERDIPVPWEMIDVWLDARKIDLTYPSWRLRALNPLTCADSDQYTVTPGQPLLVRCDPPRKPRLSGMVPPQVLLAAAPMASLSAQLGMQQSAPVTSPLLQSAQEQYFALQMPVADATYRVQVRGEAMGTSLQVRVASRKAVQPLWLHGLICTLETAQGMRTLHAFRTSPQDSGQPELHVPGDIAPAQVADLSWHMEPVGIPFSWEWEWNAPSGGLCRERLENLTSEGDLTSLWREQIWPTIAESPQSKLVLDARGFGRIELVIICTPGYLTDLAWWGNDQLAGQCIWLSRMADNTPSGQRRQPVPGPLRQWLHQSGQVQHLPENLRASLQWLATRESLPLWVLIRLRMIAVEVEKTRTGSVPGQIASQHERRDIYG